MNIPCILYIYISGPALHIYFYCSDIIRLERFHCTLKYCVLHLFTKWLITWKCGFSVDGLVVLSWAHVNLSPFNEVISHVERDIGTEVRSLDSKMIHIMSCLNIVFKHMHVVKKVCMYYIHYDICIWRSKRRNVYEYNTRKSTLFYSILYIISTYTSHNNVTTYMLLYYSKTVSIICEGHRKRTLWPLYFRKRAFLKLHAH